MPECIFHCAFMWVHVCMGVGVRLGLVLRDVMGPGEVAGPHLPEPDFGDNLPENWRKIGKGAEWSTGHCDIYSLPTRKKGG